MKVNFHLKLGPFDRATAAQVRPWRNDWRVMKWCRQTDFISDLDQERWFERQAADPTIQMYAVLTDFEGREELVGVAGLTSIDYRHRRAEFSLYLRPDSHRKGLGKEALKILLAHGFDNLGLNVIWGETFAQNPAGAMFQAQGMKLEGVRRAFYWVDGAFTDAHLYSITRGEWLERLGGGEGRVPDVVGPGGAPHSDAGGGASPEKAPVGGDILELDESGAYVNPILEALCSATAPPSRRKRRPEGVAP